MTVKVAQSANKQQAKPHSVLLPLDVQEDTINLEIEHGNELGF